MATEIPKQNPGLVHIQELALTSQHEDVITQVGALLAQESLPAVDALQGRILRAVAFRMTNQYESALAEFLRVQEQTKPSPKYLPFQVEALVGVIDVLRTSTRDEKFHQEISRYFNPIAVAEVLKDHTNGLLKQLPLNAFLTRANALAQFGLLAREQSKISEALVHYKAAKSEIDEAVSLDQHNPQLQLRQANILNFIGVIYEDRAGTASNAGKKLEDYKNAHAYQSHAYEIFTHLNNQRGRGNTAAARARMYLTQGDLEGAEFWYQHSLWIASGKLFGGNQIQPEDTDIMTVALDGLKTISQKRQTNSS